MSKELPYFKFYPDEFLTGDVTLESWDIQGIFVNMCAYYWKRDCEVTLSHLRKRYGSVTSRQWDKLLASDLLKIDGDKVTINFLDEQKQELDNEHSAKSKAGSLGAAKRWQGHSTAIIVPEAKHGNIDIDKEEDKDKDKDIKPTEVLPVGKKPIKKFDFIDQVISEFIGAYKPVNGEYVITCRGKEREAAGRILGIYKTKHPEAKSEEALQGLRAYFEACMSVQDNWLKTNMSLPIIVSKFNQINTLLRNGTTKRNSGATPGEIAELIARKFGEDSAERN